MLVHRELLSGDFSGTQAAEIGTDAIVAVGVEFFRNESRECFVSQISGMKKMWKDCPCFMHWLPRTDLTL